MEKAPQFIDALNGYAEKSHGMLSQVTLNELLDEVKNMWNLQN